jgi:hypothetical protein
MKLDHIQLVSTVELLSSWWGEIPIPFKITAVIYVVSV